VETLKLMERTHCNKQRTIRKCEQWVSIKWPKINAEHAGLAVSLTLEVVWLVSWSLHTRLSWIFLRVSSVHPDIYWDSTLIMPRSCHSKSFTNSQFDAILASRDRLCGLMIRVPAYKSGGPGFDSLHYQIFWEVVGLEWAPLSLVSITEELLE
jgi:hypothetical protein